MKEKNRSDINNTKDLFPNHRSQLTFSFAACVLGSSYRKPDLFLQNSVRVICRSFEENGRSSMKQKVVKASCTRFKQVLKDQQFTQVDFEVEYDRSSNNSSPDNVEVVLPTVSQTPEKIETVFD